MKKYSLLFVSVAIVFLFSVYVLYVTVKQNRELSNIEVLTYTNEGPGPQGQRHSQAVWCDGGGWNIQPGCCAGAENCYYLDPCNSRRFSCDGSTFYSPLDN